MQKKALRLLLAGMIAMIALITGVGTAAAATIDTAPSSQGPWQASASGAPPALKCTIHASAEGRLAWIRTPGQPTHLGLWLTTNADIHNPYLFVGCTESVTVEVLDSTGTVVATVTHNAFAGAVLDPQGNNKSYTWQDEAPIDAVDLNNVAGLEIQLGNVS